MLVLVGLADAAAAGVTLAPLFQDRAVLQRDVPVPVWGQATPASKVTVSFAGQTSETQADPRGRWMVKLKPLAASAQGMELRVAEQGGGGVVVRDVVVGEVWLASGQSNMQWPVGRANEADQALAQQPAPLLRLYQVPRKLSHVRQQTAGGSWAAASWQAAEKFSAVGYFFGKGLSAELDVPVGIIEAAWGGSRIEPWWAEEGLRDINELSKTRYQRAIRTPGMPAYDKAQREFVAKLETWLPAARAALEAGEPAPEMPAAPELLVLGHNQQTGTYQAMIHPLVPYALRGFLWYQGESNNGDGMVYAAKMRALIGGWRKQFENPSAPFLFVQLAPYAYKKERDPLDLPAIWQAQQETLKVAHTGMAVINDIGEVDNIHPRNKSEVARRLMLWALADTYGRTGLVKSGPLFEGCAPDGAAMVVRFSHTGGGLTTRDGQAPSWFELAGADGRFHPAAAVVEPDGRSLRVTSSAVPAPSQVRFAWSQAALPNLMNREGLPAAAFHSHFPQTPVEPQ